jgi:DNA processing protein
MTDDAIPPELRAHLTLALVPGLGPRLTRALLDRFGSPEAALRATRSQLEAVPKIGATLATQFVKSFASVTPDKEWDLIRKHRIELALFDQPTYPARLRTIEDAPALLYYRGCFAESDRHSVGIVGSRNCTDYGRKMARKLAAGLVRAGWTVVSGLAYGIDRAAHEAALEAGGRTLAVLAGGLAKIYPRDHVDLAEACAQQGAVLTETPMSVASQPGMFPARNRIISALSRGIVVVEANVRSGALITATHAAEQGREVFVVPGRADDAASAGCLDLLRKGARMVRDADDILEDLKGIAVPDAEPAQPKPKGSLFDHLAAGESAILPSPPPPPEPPRVLEPRQQLIWDALSTTRHADELGRTLGLSAAELTVLLMQMEMKKIIRRLPGNHFERR